MLEDRKVHLYLCFKGVCVFDNESFPLYEKQTDGYNVRLRLTTRVLFRPHHTHTSLHILTDQSRDRNRVLACTQTFIHTCTTAVHTVVDLNR